MADDRMALLELAEKHADEDFLRELGQFVLQRLMEAEAEERCGAGLHERSAERVNRRNGCRERTLETRIGTMLRHEAVDLNASRFLLLQRVDRGVGWAP